MSPNIPNADVDTTQDDDESRDLPRSPTTRNCVLDKPSGRCRLRKPGENLCEIQQRKYLFTMSQLWSKQVHIGEVNVDKRYT